MIILAGAIIISLSNNGIIGKANEAVAQNDIKQVETMAQLAWSDVYLENRGKDITAKEMKQKVEEKLTQNGVDLNKYMVHVNDKGIEVEELDRANWEYAYTYDQTKQEWSDRLTKVDGEPTGDIIAKLYKTNERITPSGEYISQEVGVTKTFTQGNGYIMIIEGKGEMGELASEDFSMVSAWIKELATYAYGPENLLTEEMMLIPYVIEVVIEDGVENIGGSAFNSAYNLRKIIIGNDVKTIENRALALCTSLISVELPNSINAIEDLAFAQCTSLTSIVIPNSVETIGPDIFGGCTNLKTINYTGSKEDWEATQIDDTNQDLFNATINYNYKGK